MLDSKKGNRPDRAGKVSTLGSMVLEIENVNFQKEKCLDCENGNMFIGGFLFSSVYIYFFNSIKMMKI